MAAEAEAAREARAKVSHQAWQGRVRRSRDGFTSTISFQQGDCCWRWNERLESAQRKQQKWSQSHHRLSNYDTCKHWAPSQLRRTRPSSSHCLSACSTLWRAQHLKLFFTYVNFPSLLICLHVTVFTVIKHVDIFTQHSWSLMLQKVSSAKPCVVLHRKFCIPFLQLDVQNSSSSEIRPFPKAVVVRFTEDRFWFRCGAQTCQGGRCNRSFPLALTTDMLR